MIGLEQPGAAGGLEGAVASGGLLRGLDPRGKLLACLGFTLVISLSPGPMAPLLGLALAVFLVVLARLAPGFLLRRMLAVNLFVGFLWLVMPWRFGWQPGQGLSAVYNPAGVALAWLISIKVNAVFLGLLTLVGTSRTIDIFHALAHLKIPAKLVAIFILFHRYLFLIHQEAGRLRRAMRARGFRPGSNWHTYRSFSQMLAMILVRSLDRADRVYQAMLCRGFEGTFWVLDHFHWRRMDTVFSLAAWPLILGLAWAAWGGAPWS